MPAALVMAAIDALFADPNLALDAVYRAGGADPGVLVRVIVRRPDRVGELGETRLVAEAEDRRSRRRGCHPPWTAANIGRSKGAAFTRLSGRTTIPLFILVQQVTVRKRLDVDGAAQKWIAAWLLATRRTDGAAVHVVRPCR